MRVTVTARFCRDRRSRYLQLVAAMLAMMHSEMAPPLTRLLARLRRGRKDKVRGQQASRSHALAMVHANADAWDGRSA